MYDIGSLLSIEENNSLWEPEIGGFKLWPLVRYICLDTATSKAKHYRSLPQQNRQVVVRESWARNARTLPWLLSSSKSSFSAVFVIANLSRYPLGDTGYSFDRSYGDFYDLIDRPLILESNPTSMTALPDQRYERQVFSQDMLWLGVALQARMWNLPRKALNEINAFASQVTNLYGVPEIQGRVYRTLFTLVKRYAALRSLILRYIVPKLSSRFALVENASYMGRSALVTKIFHEAGFHVAEAQHGLIIGSQGTYQLPPSALNNPSHPCRTYLPDSLLLYGDYWKRNVNLPLSMVTVGYPYLSRIAERARQEFSQKPKQILILSQWTITDKAVALAEELSKAFPDRKIIFKLHLGEMTLKSEFDPLKSLPNVEIMGFVDVYRLVAESEIIVGYSTTVLVEAVIFPNKRIFFNEADVVPNEVGEQFSDAEDLIEMIRDPARGIPRCDPELFWPMDWKKRLSTFLTDFDHLDVKA